MGSMRRPDVFRLLNWDEMFLLQQVFGLMVLPPREQIAVSNGLGSSAWAAKMRNIAPWAFGS